MDSDLQYCIHILVQSNSKLILSIWFFRLFGFICRLREQSGEETVYKYVCYSFECHTPSEELVSAFKSASRVAFQAALVWADAFPSLLYYCLINVHIIKHFMMCSTNRSEENNKSLFRAHLPAQLNAKRISLFKIHLSSYASFKHWSIHLHTK